MADCVTKSVIEQKEQQDDPSPNQLQVVAYEVRAHKIERNQLQDANETHVLGQITYETHHMGYLLTRNRLSSSYSCMWRNCKRVCTSDRTRAKLHVLYGLYSHIYLVDCSNIVRMCANRGGADTSKCFRQHSQNVMHKQM